MTLVWMVPATGAAAVLFALWLAYDVLRRDSGTAAMQEIAGMIFEGAMAFLSRQYRTIAIFALLTAVLLGVVVGSISGGVKEIILENDEASSLMSLIVSQVLDQVDLSDEARAAVRRWRSDHGEGTADMADLTVTMNETLGTVLDDRTTRLIRRKGWYVSTKEEV